LKSIIFDIQRREDKNYYFNLWVLFKQLVKKKETNRLNQEDFKTIFVVIISILVIYLSFNLLFNKEVSNPSEFEKFRNCQDVTCCRYCYRGVFEKGLEYFEEGAVPLSFQHELRDINEHFSISNLDEYEVSKIREEQIRIENRIGDKSKVDMYWNNVFGLDN
jgi:hypothetical protein